jgi:hypothetical protein
MYVPANGMNGMGAFRRKRSRRGMAGSSVVIGPDGQPRVVTDTPINVDTVLPSGTNVIQDASGNVIYASSASTTWIPGIPNWVVGVAGSTIGILLMKAMR